MKKLFTLFALTLGLTASASHLLGGFINTTQQGSNDTVEITVTLFTDPQGLPGGTSITLNTLTKINSFYQSPTNIVVPFNSSTTWQGVNVNIYKTKKYLQAGEYRFIYTDCCRSFLANATSAPNSNFTIALDYKKNALGTVPNSAPYIMNYLPINWVNNSPSQSIIFVVDNDGDSISVVMDDAINQHANNTFVPLAPFTQLTSYGSYSVSPNGIVKWTPNTIGKFGTGFRINEYRNGQLIGVSRIQQVFQVVNGTTPIVTNPVNITINPNITAIISHDVLKGDSISVGFTASNFTNASIVIPGVSVIQTSNTTWVLKDLVYPGKHYGYIRVSGTTSNFDIPLTLSIVSTIGIEEIETPNQQYKVYDWYGKFCGTTLDGLKGLFVVRYDNGTYKKVMIQ